MSDINFKSLEECLNKYIPPDELKEVNRILYGKSFNANENLPEKVQKLCKENNFIVKCYSINAQKEQLRQPRIVKIAAIQNSICLPTDYPINDQRKAIHDLISKIIEAASLLNVNIICMQEAWSKF